MLVLSGFHTTKIFCFTFFCFSVIWPKSYNSKNWDLNSNLILFTVIYIRSKHIIHLWKPLEKNFHNKYIFIPIWPIFQFQTKEIKLAQNKTTPPAIKLRIQRDQPCIPLIPTTQEDKRQEDCKLETSRGIIVRPSLTRKTKYFVYLI